MKEFKKVPFVESNVIYIPNANLFEHFVVSINNVNTRVYLRRYIADSQTGKAKEARDLEPEQTLIDSFNPGDLVDLVLHDYHWRISDRSGIKYYLISISKSL